MKLTKLEGTPGVIRLSCEGEITQQTIPPGQDPLEQAVGAGGFSSVVLLNLEKTHYIDSSGISWLLIRHKHFLQAGGRLVLHSVPPLVDQVLRLLKMYLVLNIAADEAAALALVSEGKS
jgi:anti-anti-sigma factor